jgi:hypothetical protein
MDGQFRAFPNVARKSDLESTLHSKSYIHHIHHGTGRTNTIIIIQRTRVRRSSYRHSIVLRTNLERRRPQYPYRVWVSHASRRGPRGKADRVVEDYIYSLRSSRVIVFSFHVRFQNLIVRRICGT